MNHNSKELELLNKLASLIWELALEKNEWAMEEILNRCKPKASANEERKPRDKD